MWEVLWIYEGPFLCIESYSEVGRKTNHCPARFQAQNLVIKVSYIIWIICIPPWKIYMKPTNHPCKKEHDLPNLQGMMFQPLIFRGVPLETLELYLALVLSSLSSLNYKHMSLCYKAFEPNAPHSIDTFFGYTLTPLKFNIVHLNINPLEVWRFRTWKPSFSGAMSNFGVVFSPYLTLVFRIVTWCIRLGPPSTVNPVESHMKVYLDSFLSTTKDQHFMGI